MRKGQFQIWVLALGMCLPLLQSCDLVTKQFGGDTEENSQDSLVRVDSGIVESILLTRIDQLRIRRYPNLKSNIVTTLDDNMPVRYMGEETDFTETIGKESGTWKRVRTLDDIHEGWVYSAPGFVEWMITPLQRDSLTKEGKGLMVFGNLTKPEFAKWTGSSLAGQAVGTRYSGWYTFVLGEDAKVINDKVRVVAKLLDTEKKKVRYVHCSLDVSNGMPQSELICPELKENE